MKTQPSEAEFTRMVVDLARLHRWRVAHFRPARVRRGGRETYETPFAADGKGYPDLTMVRGSRLIFAELKVGKNRESPEQRAWLDALARTSAEVRLWYFPGDWQEIVKTLSEDG